jgi:putative ABC transport system permease protein
MIKHYLKTVFRISRRFGNISIINILGLSIGLATCIMIFIYVKFETSYDSFHNDNDRIFRIEEESNQHSNGARRARCTNFIGLAIEKMDESEAVGRITSQRPSTVRYEDIAFKEDRIFKISPGILNILTIKILEGNPVHEISRPNTVILTETIRKRYFGDREAVGKLIKIDSALFEVVGVVKDIPSNSHFHADLMISALTRDSPEEMPERLILYGYSLYTYIKLKPNVDPLLFDNKIRDIAELLAPEVIKESGEKIQCFLDPVKDIHLNNYVIENIETPGNKSFLYLISVIGVLALITTCLNYMNLSTARFINRTKEIGVRKTFGAGKMQLSVQFLGESLFLVFIAHFIAMALVETGLIFINKIVQVQLKVPYLDPDFAIFLVSIIIFTGLLAGSYPAFMLSSVNPVNVMKGAMTPGKSSYIFRRVLISFQFMISIFLIMATFIITRQLNYMKNSSLGFIKEQKLVFQLPEGKVDERNYERVKLTFAENPSVTGTSVSSSVPGRWMYSWQLWPTEERTANTQIINCMQADPDFSKLYGLEIIAGEPFDDKLSRQENLGMLINESAIKAFGWSSAEEALTKTLMNDREIIRGVVKDYHFRGKNEEIGPLAFFLIGEDYRYITLVFREDKAENVLKEAREKYKELFPDAAEDYFFLDEDFNKQYNKEQTTNSLVLIFTVIAIFIACLGLYGITAYTLESKRHTYGIIKVNGGMPMQIYFGILKEFLVWIGLAFVVVSPLIYLAGTKWLMQFPYRTDISIWVFIFSGLILLVITIITISLETYKIFLLNPVDTIRNE